MRQPGVVSLAESDFVIHLDAGHLGQTFHLVCTALGLAPFVLECLLSLAMAALAQAPAVDVPKLKCEPKPVQSALPIWIGGGGDMISTTEDLRTFILAMLQADTFGVSISRLLRSQADEMRVRRRLRAQQAAQKLALPVALARDGQAVHRAG